MEDDLNIFGNGKQSRIFKWKTTSILFLATYRAEIWFNIGSTQQDEIWRTTLIFKKNGRRPKFFENGKQPQFVFNRRPTQFFDNGRQP
jgi:hypothetical protein